MSLPAVWTLTRRSPTLLIICEAAGEAWDDAKGTGLCDGVPGERATWVCDDDGCEEVHVECANFVEGWPAQELVDAVYAACCDVKFLQKNFALSNSEEAGMLFDWNGKWPCRMNPIATPERGTRHVRWRGVDQYGSRAHRKDEGCRLQAAGACLHRNLGNFPDGVRRRALEQEREILATDPSCLELGTCSDGASTCYFKDFQRLCTIGEALSIMKALGNPFKEGTMCSVACTDLPAPDGGFLVESVAYSTCDEARGDGGKSDCIASGVPFTGAESCCGCSEQMGRDFGVEGQGGSWEFTLGCVEPAWDTCNPFIYPQGHPLYTWREGAAPNASACPPTRMQQSYRAQNGATPRRAQRVESAGGGVGSRASWIMRARAVVCIVSRRPMRRRCGPALTRRRPHDYVEPRRACRRRLLPPDHRRRGHRRHALFEGRARAVSPFFLGYRLLASILRIPHTVTSGLGRGVTAPPLSVEGRRH
jgi:hypothetical protein